MGGAVAAGAGHRATRRSSRDHREHLQPGQLRGVRGRQGEQELPPGWKPGYKAAQVLQLPDFAAIATSHQDEQADSPAVQPTSILSQLAASFLDWELYKQAIPDLF
jgi:hypothetical protein